MFRGFRGEAGEGDAGEKFVEGGFVDETWEAGGKGAVEEQGRGGCGLGAGVA